MADVDGGRHLSATLVIGVAIAKIALRLHGQSDWADVLDDVAGPLPKLREKLKDRRGIGVLGSQVADELDQALTIEFSQADPNDIRAAVSELAELLNAQLGETAWRVQAVVEPKALRRLLLEGGGSARARALGGEAEAVFRMLLDQSVARLIKLAPGSTGFPKEALVNLLISAAENAAKLDELLARPVAGVVLANDADPYVEQIRALAPPILFERESELSEMVEFATTDASTWFGYEAKPKAGKTALLATFCLHPPVGVRVAPFFIRRNQSNARTREAYLGVILANLARITNREAVPYPSNIHQETTILHSLLREAAATLQSSSPPQNLALVLDGMDEDAYYSDPTHQSGSIAALLPHTPPSGVKIILARRANPPPPNDLPEAGLDRLHPLYDPKTWRPLAVSPHAESAFTDDDIADLTRTRNGLHLAGFLAVAGAPLTGDDLTELLTFLQPDITYDTVQDLLVRAPGRLLISVPNAQRTMGRGYALGHDLIHHAVIQRILPGNRTLPEMDDVTAWDSLAREAFLTYRQTIRKWGRIYTLQNWPPHTPDYLLSEAYQDLLRDDLDLGDLAGLESFVIQLTSPERTARVREASGSNSASLQQIRTATDYILSSGHGSTNLTLLGRLLVSDFALASADQPIQLLLPGFGSLSEQPQVERALSNAVDALLFLGARESAVDAAERLTDQTLKLARISSIAMSYISSGNPEQAVRVAKRAMVLAAHTLSGPLRSESIARIVQCFVMLSDYERAAAAHELISDNFGRARCSSILAGGYAESGSISDAHRFAIATEAAAGQVADEHEKVQALCWAAQAYTVAKDSSSAIRVASVALDAAEDVRPLMRVAGALRELRPLLSYEEFPDEVLRVASLIRREKRSREFALARTLEMLARSYLAAGLREQALAVAQDIRLTSLRVPTIDLIASQFPISKKSSQPTASPLSFGDARRITDRTDLVHDLGHVGGAIYGIHWRTRARLVHRSGVLPYMLQTARLLLESNLNVHAVSLARISLALAERDKYPDAPILADLADLFVDVGDTLHGHWILSLAWQAERFVSYGWDAFAKLDPPGVVATAQLLTEATERMR